MQKTAVIIKSTTIFTLIFLFLFLAVFGLQGCRQTKNAKTTKLIFCAEADADYIALYNKIITCFEKKHPNIKIQPIYVQGDYYPKVLTMFASGTEPDVFWMGQGFGDFAKRGCLLGLDSLVKPTLVEQIKSFAPAVLDLYRYKGKLMGIPAGINVAILFYNVTLFDQAGIKYPDETWNMDDFLAAAKALTRDLNGDGKPEQFGVLVGRPIFLLNSFGGSILSAGGTKCNLASKESVEALAFIRDLTTRYKVSPKQANGTAEGFIGQEPFLTGRVGMIVGMDVNLEHTRKSIKNFKWDIAPIPCKTKRNYWASSSGYCVSANSKSKKEAVTFAEFLASDPEAQKIMAPMGIPIDRRIAAEVVSETTVPKHAEYLLEIIKDINPTPRVPGITQIESIAKSWEEKALLEIISPETAYKEAAKEITTHLSSAQ